MKKIMLLLFSFACAAILLAACREERPEPVVTTNPTSASDSTAPTNQTEPTTVPTEPSETTQPTDSSETTEPTTPNPFEYLPGSIKLEDQNQDDYDFERKYRITYYRIWGEFFALLTDEQMDDFGVWLEKNSKETNYGEFQNEMLLVTMVKRYNIPREEFDQAVDKFVANNQANGTNMTCEEYEIPNADIIYTFDNEIINYYYRYA